MSLRTVGVRLKAQVAEYKSAMRDAKTSTKSFSDELVDAAKKGDASAAAISKGAAKAADALDDLGDAADEAGDELDELRRHASKLDGQIAETATSIRALAREIVATSDKAGRAKLLGDLTAQRRELRELVDLRKTMDVDTGGSGAKIGEQLAAGASVSFVQRLGPMIARAPVGAMNPAVAAIGAPLVAGLVTLVGTAVGGAIIGAVGTGGVVGGIALAGRSPLVKAKATELGEDLGLMFGSSASAFVPETLDALDTVRDRVLAMEPSFRRVFTSASRYVDPLVDGLLDAAENAMPGIIDAVDEAGPVIEAVAEGLRDMGDALGDGLSDLAPYADEGARALSVLFLVVESGTRGVFLFVEGLSRLYKVAELVGALASGDVARFYTLASTWDETSNSATGLTDALPPLSRGITDVAAAAEATAVKVVDMKAAFDDLYNAQMTYDEANLAYKQGLADLRKELGDGARTLDENTQAGRDNRDAVLEQIGKIKELRDARIAHNGKVDEANAKYSAEIAALKATMRQMGFTQTEIDELVAAYEEIPGRVSTEVWVETATGERQLAGFMKKVQRADGTTITVRTRITSAGEYIPGVGTLTRRWGGVTEYAQAGKLRDAQIASPMGPARYGWAEQATGGELFAPKYGDMNRTRALVSYAVENWWGGWQNFAPPQVVPVPTGGSSAPPEVRVYLGDRELTDIVRVEVSEHSRDLKRRASAGMR
ncbi:hypothetical protein [Micromonospora sp. NPDC047730]|uniref:hypothetical protein n=1 Tax=Micromonospora sp. NPDC047730 TaxID=3364253 RepID=UPI0037221D2F